MAMKKRQLTSQVSHSLIDMVASQLARREWAQVFPVPCNQPLAEASLAEAASTRCTICQTKYRMQSVISGIQAPTGSSNINNHNLTTHQESQLTCRIRMMVFLLDLVSNRGAYQLIIMIFKIQCKIITQLALIILGSTQVGIMIISIKRSLDNMRNIRQDTIK